MASPVDICNSALIKIGVEPIVSLDDDSKEARLCKEQYPKIRDEIIGSHLWNFAMKRETLADLGITPAFGYSYTFALPADYIRVLHTNNKSIRFKIEQNKRLLTNLDSISILYIAKIEDVSMYSPIFREALAYQLAVDLSYALVQNSSLSERLNAKAMIKLRDARSFDGQEGTPDELMADVWLNDRIGNPLGDYLYDDEI